MEATSAYKEGDWIVHAHYGIGQIKCVEVKGISGEAVSYFRIEATDSTFWMPVDQINGEMSRPVSSRKDFQKALDVLSNPPQEMSASHIERQSRIKRVRMENSPEDIARLIRDLRARQRDKGILSQNERSAFTALKQQLIEEWTIVTGKQPEIIASQVNRLLENQNTVESQDVGS